MIHLKIETFEKYQKEVQRTRSFNDTELINYTLGLVCESGEFGDMIKKHLFHNHDLDIEEVKKELGDVMWYLSNLCNVLEIELSDVATGNIEKLKSRYPNGFSCDDSINRVE
ncbi:nucleoside triphosphate pyrophosphohydrolase family protein [Romboutsia sp.]|uniref:nucleoside triphosphate pyrophosphohydrolase family protein n=1 Tax=Romboutsia sp. TaxID=1965302 RepID=UPI003F3B5B84